MFTKITVSIFALMVMVLFFDSCDDSPKIYTRPGTEEHMAMTRPTIDKWAYEVKTFSRTYLTLNLSKDAKGAYTLKTYYVYNGKKWEYRRDTIILDPKDYGNIIVHKAPDIEIR